MTARLSLIAALMVGLLVALMTARSHYIGVGVAQERAVWKAAQDQSASEAAESYAETVRLGNRAAAAALADEAGRRVFADQLQKERRDAVLVRPNRIALGACAPGPDADRAEPLRADVGRPNSHAPAEFDAHGTVASPHLTAAAVWLWDAALSGGEGGQLPADPCRAAGAAAGACVVETDVTLSDAWDNQAANALSCSIDRQRYRRLIDFVTMRKD